MGQVKQLDQRMNEAGYLRLMPLEPYAMNLSNTLSAREKSPAPERKTPFRWKEWTPVRKLLLAVYNRIFKLYYGQD